MRYIHIQESEREPHGRGLMISSSEVGGCCRVQVARWPTPYTRLPALPTSSSQAVAASARCAGFPFCIPSPPEAPTFLLFSPLHTLFSLSLFTFSLVRDLRKFRGSLAPLPSRIVRASANFRARRESQGCKVAFFPLFSLLARRQWRRVKGASPYSRPPFFAKLRPTIALPDGRAIANRDISSVGRCVYVRGAPLRYFVIYRRACARCFVYVTSGGVVATA